MKMRKYLTILFTGSMLLFFQNCGQSVDFEAIESSKESFGNERPNTAPAQNSGESTAVVEVGAPTTVEVPTIPEDPYAPTNENVSLLPTVGEWASIAYEDNVLSPDYGDRDFNDAVFNYKVAEQYNSLNQLVRIFMQVRLRANLSGNSHRLLLVLDGNANRHFDNLTKNSSPAFFGDANVAVEYDDATSTVFNVQDKVNIFKTTKGHQGEVTNIVIDISNPELNVVSEVTSVDFKKYRLILQNAYNGNGDPLDEHDRIGIDIAEINATNDMINSSGYPLGFMIPTDWNPPLEGQMIDSKYPNFEQYRAWLLNQSSDLTAAIINWFN